MKGTCPARSSLLFEDHHSKRLELWAWDLSSVYIILNIFWAQPSPHW